MPQQKELCTGGVCGKITGENHGGTAYADHYTAGHGCHHAAAGARPDRRCGRVRRAQPMQRDRRKRHPPARHPVLLRRVLLVLCILAVLWLGYSCMMPQLLFSARGTMIFVPDPPLRR